MFRSIMAAGIIRGCVLAVLLLVPLLDAREVRAEDDVPPADTPGLLHGIRTGEDRGVDLQRRFGSALSITPSYFYRDRRASMKLLTDGLQRDAMDFSVKSSLPGGLTGEGEVAFSSFDSQEERIDRDRQKRYLRFKLAGDTGFFGYGSEYRSVGQGFRPQSGGDLRRDREGTESWVERKIGWLGFKAVNTEYWDNVDADPRRPRTTFNIMGGVTTLSLPSWPTLSLSYMSGTSEKIDPRKRGAPQEKTVQQYSASLYYWRPTWDVSLTSMLGPSRDRFMPAYETQSYYHEASFTYRPNDRISITPYIAYSEDQYKWTGTKSYNPMGMLSMSWSSIIKGVDFYSYSSYMKSKSTDGAMDTTTIMSINSFIYDLGEKKGHKYLSFDVLYSQYTDVVYRDYSYKEILGRVMFTLAAF